VWEARWRCAESGERAVRGPQPSVLGGSCGVWGVWRVAALRRRGAGGARPRAARAAAAPDRRPPAPRTGTRSPAPAPATADRPTGPPAPGARDARPGAGGGLDGAPPHHIDTHDSTYVAPLRVSRSGLSALHNTFTRSRVKYFPRHTVHEVHEDVCAS
jgi:hypothetical protein